jgi:hypothetical protein
MVKQVTAATQHGGSLLPAVGVRSYSVELKDDEGFIGDRASKGAFHQFIENWRKPLREIGHDPFGEESTTKIAKEDLDELLTKGEPAAGVIHRSIESFAQELAVVIHDFLKLKEWKEARRLVIGGGFSRVPIGELAIARTSTLLKSEKIEAEICIIRNNPNEAGLLGAVHLVPSGMLEAYDSILAVDIGGTSVRAGIVRLNLEIAEDLSKAKVWKFELWRHRDQKLSRDNVIQGLVNMLKRQVNQAKEDGGN